MGNGQVCVSHDGDGVVANSTEKQLKNWFALKLM